MHATHFQDWPNMVWNFPNPIRTDRVNLIVEDMNGSRLVPVKTRLGRDRIILTFQERTTGHVLITDCMDDVW